MLVRVRVVVRSKCVHWILADNIEYVLLKVQTCLLHHLTVLNCIQKDRRYFFALLSLRCGRVRVFDCFVVDEKISCFSVFFSSERGLIIEEFAHVHGRRI